MAHVVNDEVVINFRIRILSSLLLLLTYPKEAIDNPRVSPIVVFICVFNVILSPSNNFLKDLYESFPCVQALAVSQHGEQVQWPAEPFRDADDAVGEYRKETSDFCTNCFRGIIAEQPSTDRFQGEALYIVQHCYLLSYGKPLNIIKGQVTPTSILCRKITFDLRKTIKCGQHGARIHLHFLTRFIIYYWQWVLDA